MLMFLAKMNFHESNFGFGIRMCAVRFVARYNRFRKIRVVGTPLSTLSFEHIPCCDCRKSFETFASPGRKPYMITKKHIVVFHDLHRSINSPNG